jgi:hypothetical protein
MNMSERRLIEWAASRAGQATPAYLMLKLRQKKRVRVFCDLDHQGAVGIMRRRP